MDEPTADPAIITAYLVCREARKQATVLLSGVGGDELFAGYRKHSAHYWAQIIKAPVRCGEPNRLLGASFFARDLDLKGSFASPKRWRAAFTLAQQNAL